MSIVQIKKKIPQNMLKCSTPDHKNHFKVHIVAYDSELFETYTLDRKILATLKEYVFLPFSLK